MKAAELRIGNKVNRHFENGEPEEIDCSVRDIFDCQRAENEKEFKFSFSPIPLTEEWLKRIDWRGYKYLYFNSSFCLDESGHLYYSGDYTGINVSYVHQLQNLYFSLTGEELNY